MPHFEFDELIEVSDHIDFARSDCFRFRYNCADTLEEKNTTRNYAVYDNGIGQIVDYQYARKVQPTVNISLYFDSHTFNGKIRREFADKIINGEFNA
mgnify:CR=1 FL=1